MATNEKLTVVTGPSKGIIAAIPKTSATRLNLLTALP
jgi:hypothetical protein